MKAPLLHPVWVAMVGFWALGQVGLGGCSPSPSAAVASQAAGADLVVRRGDLVDRLALTGEVEAISSQNLVVPRTPSWLLTVRWLIEDGAAVKEGDKIAEFDSSSFAGSIDDKRLAVLNAASELAGQMASSAATLADKRMEVERKQAERDKARVQAEVDADLYPRRLFQEKQQALARAEDALAKAKADLESQERAARLDQKIKQVALDKSERDLVDLMGRLEELTLRAPRDGLVQIGTNLRERRRFLVGDQAFPGWVVARMPDLSGMRVRALLPDVDDGSVAPGLRTQSVLDAYPDQVFSGRIEQLSPVARMEGQQSDRRFFDVLVSLDLKGGGRPDFLRPGMSVRVEVMRRRIEKGLLVPRAAVHTWPGKTSVVRKDGSRQEVDIGWCTDLTCVVESGDLVEGTMLSTAAPTSREAT